MSIAGARTAKSVVGALVTALVAMAFFAAVEGATAALPTKNTLYTGQLTDDGKVVGSIRIKVQKNRERISKLVVRAQTCEGITSVRVVKNLGISTDRMYNGKFGATTEIEGALFKIDKASFKSSSKASGEVFVGETACGRGFVYEFTATK